MVVFYRLHGINGWAHFIPSIPIALLVLFISFSYYRLMRSMYVMAIENPESDSMFVGSTKLVEISAFMASLSIYLTTIFGYVISLINNRQELKFYNELSYLDKRLSIRLNIFVDYKKCRRNILRLSIVKYIYLVFLLNPVISGGLSINFTPYLLSLYFSHIFLSVDWFSLYVCASLLQERLVLIRKIINDIENKRELGYVEVEILKIYQLKNDMTKLWGLKIPINVARDLTVSTYNLFFAFWVADSGSASFLNMAFGFVCGARHVYKTFLVLFKCQSLYDEVNFITECLKETFL